ncbi:MULTISPECIES: hypothetical protein [unclassified Okeania]|nr:MULTISPECIES: hypothetical protein [unclassified Okeania]NET22748.1 hypothetical protein [Okeania sp. SIO1H5]NET95721.1 hypothetical protein [Okeania sp. SIO1H2]
MGFFLSYKATSLLYHVSIVIDISRKEGVGSFALGSREPTPRPSPSQEGK